MEQRTKGRGWSFARAHYLPARPRARLFCDLMRRTWRLRKAHGGAFHVVMSNFKLATWLRPSGPRIKGLRQKRHD